MKTFFTLLMPLLVVITFIASSKLFAKEDYLVSAAFTLMSYSAASLWVWILGSKKLSLH